MRVIINFSDMGNEKPTSIPSENENTHTVKRGETLSQIVADLNKKGSNITLQDIIKWNDIKNPNSIPVGKILRLKEPVDTKVLEIGVQAASVVAEKDAWQKIEERRAAEAELKNAFSALDAGASSIPNGTNVVTTTVINPANILEGGSNTRGVERKSTKLDGVLASLNNTSVDLPRRLTLDGGDIYDNWSEFIEALDNRPEIKNRIQQMIANLLPQGKQIDANTIKIGGLFSNNAGKGFIFTTGDEQYVFLRGKNNSIYSARSLIDVENPPRPQVLREDFGPSKDKDINKYNPSSLYTESGTRFWQDRLKNVASKELSPSDKDYFQVAILYGIEKGIFRYGGINETHTPQFNTNGIKPSDVIIKDYNINGITFQIQGKDGTLKFDSTNQKFALSKVEANYA